MANSLSTAKRRVLEHLKRSDGATASEVAGALGITEAAVRQHLDALVERGLVERRALPRARAGRGRSPLEWVLTPEAASQFADRHGQLTVELLDAMRDALGADGIDRVIDSRAGAAARGLPRSCPPRARRRSNGGCARSRANGRPRATWPTCTARRRRRSRRAPLPDLHCGDRVPRLLPFELELFRDTLGPDVTVERTAHLLAGDVRCAYLIRPVHAPVAVS